MIRLAVIGFGGYGWQLAETILRYSQRLNCGLVGAADARLSDLSEKAGRLRASDVELYDDAFVMLESLSGQCDGVYIATGIDSHVELTLAAARCRMHVHLEKPPAATVQEVDRMQQALDRAGCFCLVGFHQIHGAETLFLKQAIASGRLGAVRTITCKAGWPRTRQYYQRNDWAGRLRRGGRWVLDGPATNALAHQVNNMLFLAGPGPGDYAEPASVRAELYAAGDVDSHDTAAIEIHTTGGATCYWLGSHCTDVQFGPEIEIRAERGSATWQPTRRAEIVRADGARESAVADDCHANMVENFVRAIRDGDPSSLRCTLVDSRQFVLALDGAHESSRTIHRIGPEHVRKVDAGGPDERTVVDGLDDVLDRSASGACLFSDLKPVPDWAVATETYDLSGYGGFPQQFRA